MISLIKLLSKMYNIYDVICQNEMARQTQIVETGLREEAFWRVPWYQQPHHHFDQSKQKIHSIQGIQGEIVLCEEGFEDCDH